MKHSTKRILPILLVIVTILSILWYLFIYDRDFTRDMLLHQARLFESYGQHSIASWLYDQAYRQADNNDAVAIELAQETIPRRKLRFPRPSPSPPQQSCTLPCARPM